MPTPSLLIVPSRFKSGKLYSQLPTSGAGDFTVTRATNATRVNASGFIEVQKTNLALRSEEFRTIAEGGPSNTWTANDTVIISVNNPSPDGTNNATRIRGAASPTNRARQQTITGTSGVAYVGSAWIRRVSGTSPITLRVGDAGSTTNISPTSTWQRYSFSSTPTTTTVRIGFVFPNDTDEFEIWGAQLEEGSSASEYIPTTTVARTRFAGVTVDGTVATNIPRLDYLASDGTVGCPALLVEPAGTNLVFHSEVWTSGNNWIFADGVTSVSASITAPDNTQAVNALSPTSANSSHFFYSNNPTTITYTSGTIYTQSIFFKQGTGAAGRYVQLTYPSARFTQLGFANFDLQGGVVTASGGTADTNRNARIENYGNGWYRCIFTATCNSTGTGVGVLPTLITTSGATRLPTFSGTVTDVIYGWGAQLETGSVATSYIPTTTASVTRNADVISVSGAVSGSIGQTEGTIYAEVDVRNFANAGIFFSISDGTSSNRVQVYKFTDSKIYADRISATQSALTSISTSALTTGIYKLAFAYKTGDSALFINGVQIGSTALQTFTMGALIKVNVGTRFDNTQFLNDRILDAALYTTRLSNAELAALTSL